MMYHGMLNQFLEFGKEIPYCKVIGKMFSNNRNANPWTVVFEMKHIVELNMATDICICMMCIEPK